MSNKMKILMVAVDVTNMSFNDMSNLQLAMEVQCEDYPKATIVNSEIKLMEDIEGLIGDDNGGGNATH